MLEFEYEGVVYETICDELEEAVHNVTGVPTMTFIAEDLFDKFPKGAKEKLNSTDNDYSVDDMLAMDVMLIVTEPEFDKALYIESVETYKEDKHCFVIVTEK